MTTEFRAQHLQCPYIGLLYSKIPGPDVVMWPIEMKCPGCSTIYEACNYCVSPIHYDSCSLGGCNGCISYRGCSKCQCPLVRQDLR